MKTYLNFLSLISFCTETPNSVLYRKNQILLFMKTLRFVFSSRLALGIPEQTLIIALSIIPTMSHAKESQNQQVICETMELKNIQAFVDHKQIKELVFFASWCTSCKDHIVKAKKDESVFVVAFDQKEAAEDALNAILKNEEKAQSRCVFDSSTTIREHYGANFLPFRVEL